jgi:UDP-N-acetylglucosamine 4,6-dehydratase
VGAVGQPKLSVVRYGNVLGSRGSVIPMWKQLIENGSPSLPITDKRMTRFWITLEQSVDFVIECLTRARGGEIFIPKIPSMRIEDLANAMAPDLPHTYSGIREGEKLHELMISTEDAVHTREYDDHFMIIPEAYSHNPEFLKEYLKGRQGKELPEGFTYTSNTNTEWLNAKQLRELITSL